MTDIRMADVSEFQQNVDADSYLKAGYKCLICRTYNGYRADYKMPGRRDYLRGRDFTALGWYAYLAADVDATEQAHAFVGTIGELRANEFPILDVEEGSGDQTGRASAWFKVVDAWAGFPAMLYSGESFLSSQLGGAGRWSGRPIWIAAYRDSEPTAAHCLWQFSDAYYFAGIGSCDGNLYHGSADDFADDVRPGASSGLAPGPELDDELDEFVVVKDDGRLETFVVDAGGTVWHTWQAPGGGWQGSAPGKNASWSSLGTPGG